MTLKTKTAIGTEITANLADNTTGAITPALLRTVVQDIVDSYADWVAPAFFSFAITGVDFNSGNTDNAIAITLPTGRTRYQVHSVNISNANHTLVTATFGLYTAAAAGGVGILTAQAITVSATADATANNSQVIGASTTQSFTAATLYFRIGTAEGAAATGDVTLTLKPFP